MPRQSVSKLLVTLAISSYAVSVPAKGAETQAGASGSAIAGWVENGWIGEPAIKIKVKLDTGAKNSSIDAPSYREFEKGGQPYVSFVLTNNEGAQVTLEKPVTRNARIRRSGVGTKERPVIMLTICVAGVTSEVEFTLADRSEMNYPVLIGRSFLAEKILVDSSRTFIASNLCAKK